MARKEATLKKALPTAGFIATLVRAACATIIHGTRQSVGSTGTPSAATVYGNGQLLGKTPMVAELLGENDHRARIELKGFAPYETVLTRHLSGWFFPNILFGGLLGIVTEAADGAMHRQKPVAVSASWVQTTGATARLDGLVTAASPSPAVAGVRIGQMKRLFPEEKRPLQGRALR